MDPNERFGKNHVSEIKPTSELIFICRGIGCLSLSEVFPLFIFNPFEWGLLGINHIGGKDRPSEKRKDGSFFRKD